MGDVLKDKLESLEEPVEAHVLVGGSEDNFIVFLPLFQIVQEPRQRAEAGNLFISNPFSDVFIICCLK